MYKNYEKRVKDFIIEMSNPESKVEIKDLSPKINNIRYNLSPEKKPFVVNGYSSEEERIKNTIHNNKYLYNLPDYDKIISERELKNKIQLTEVSPRINLFRIDTNNNNNGNNSDNDNNNNEKFKLPAFAKNRYRRFSIKDKQKFNYLMKNDLIIQPQMRFKPRTDLERVYDVLNGYHYNEKEKAIVERQLKSINLYDFKRPNDLLKIKNKNKTAEEKLSEKKKYKFSTEVTNEILQDKKLAKRNRDLFKMSKLYYDPKKNSYKSWARQEDLNKGAYGILKDYHYKLYFKAAEEIAENTRNDNYKNFRNNKSSNFLLPNLISHKSNNKKKKTEENEDDVFKFDENSEEEQSEEEDYDDDLYNNNFNPLIEKQKVKSTPELMAKLSKIAFKYPERNPSLVKNNLNDESEGNKKNISNNKHEKNRNYIDGNHVLIGNKVYAKNTQMDLIAGKVLEICNANRHKSIFNNTSLKAKNGKTMITRGLTVGQFEKKYDL